MQQSSPRAHAFAAARFSLCRYIVLDAFLIENRDAIIARTRVRVATRESPKPSHEELTNGIPLFLDQLGDALRRAGSNEVLDHEALRESARRNGEDLLRMGLTVAQVVRDYGDVCQAVTMLAIEQNAPIPSAEFQTLNLCLDDAIAEAVTEYSRRREAAIGIQGTERLGTLAHEMRNLLTTAMLSFETLATGRVAVGGSTGQVHRRTLVALRDLLDRSLADVRLDGGSKFVERISVREFLEELDLTGMIQAQAREIHFVVASVDAAATVEGDRQILAAAISNLLQNAFKFTPKGGHVSLKTRLTADRVLFDVEDECGGLADGDVEGMFRPFVQRGKDRSGVGLGLSICLKAAHAHGGEVHVRNLPDKGCVFTFELPRAPAP